MEQDKVNIKNNIIACGSEFYALNANQNSAVVQRLFFSKQTNTWEEKPIKYSSLCSLKAYDEEYGNVSNLSVTHGSKRRRKKVDWATHVAICYEEEEYYTEMRCFQEANTDLSTTNTTTTRTNLNDYYQFVAYMFRCDTWSVRWAVGVSCSSEPLEILQLKAVNPFIICGICKYKSEKHPQLFISSQSHVKRVTHLENSKHRQFVAPLLPISLPELKSDILSFSVIKVGSKMEVNNIEAEYKAIDNNNTNNADVNLVDIKEQKHNKKTKAVVIDNISENNTRHTNLNEADKAKETTTTTTTTSILKFHILTSNYEIYEAVVNVNKIVARNKLTITPQYITKLAWTKEQQNMEMKADSLLPECERICLYNKYSKYLIIICTERSNNITIEENCYISDFNDGINENRKVFNAKELELASTITSVEFLDAHHCIVLTSTPYPALHFISTIPFQEHNRILMEINILPALPLPFEPICINYDTDKQLICLVCSTIPLKEFNLLTDNEKSNTLIYTNLSFANGPCTFNELIKSKWVMLHHVSEVKKSEFIRRSHELKEETEYNMLPELTGLCHDNRKSDFSEYKEIHDVINSAHEHYTSACYALVSKVHRNFSLESSSSNYIANVTDISVLEIKENKTCKKMEQQRINAQELIQYNKNIDNNSRCKYHRVEKHPFTIFCITTSTNSHNKLVKQWHNGAVNLQRMFNYYENYTTILLLLPWNPTHLRRALRLLSPTILCKMLTDANKSVCSLEQSFSESYINYINEESRSKKHKTKARHLTQEFHLPHETAKSVETNVITLPIFVTRVIDVISQLIILNKQCNLNLKAENFMFVTVALRACRSVAHEISTKIPRSLIFVKTFLRSNALLKLLNKEHLCSVEKYSVAHVENVRSSQISMANNYSNEYTEETHDYSENSAFYKNDTKNVASKRYTDVNTLHDKTCLYSLSSVDMLPDNKKNSIKYRLLRYQTHNWSERVYLEQAKHHKVVTKTQQILQELSQSLAYNDNFCLSLSDWQEVGTHPHHDVLFDLFERPIRFC